MVREPVHFRQDGQVPGLPGNSGNSDLPHLPFPVVTDHSHHYGVEGGGRAQVMSGSGRERDRVWKGGKNRLAGAGSPRW
jgi:hypothetical protein